MDYNTLVERLLDGTITDAERAELDRQTASSPERAVEVRSLMEVERLLTLQAAEEDAQSLTFRESVRASLKTSLGFATAATATDAHAPTPSGSTTSGNGSERRWYALAALALLLIGGAVVSYMALRTTPGNSSTASRTTADTPAQAVPLSVPDTTPAAAITEAAPQATTEAPAQRSQSDNSAAGTPDSKHTDNSGTAAQSEQTPQETPSRPREVEGTVQTQSDKTSRYTAVLRQALQRLDEQERTSRATAAVTAKQVAILYDKLGDAANARRYFDTARRYAQEAALREADGEIAAEYALFELRAGNRSRAEALATEAVDILRTTRSSRLAFWETELAALIH